MAGGRYRRSRAGESRGGGVCAGLQERDGGWVRDDDGGQRARGGGGGGDGSRGGSVDGQGHGAGDRARDDGGGARRGFDRACPRGSRDAASVGCGQRVQRPRGGGGREPVSGASSCRIVTKSIGASPEREQME